MKHTVTLVNRFLLLVCVSFPFAGNADDAVSSHPVIVVMGGYNSCPRTTEWFNSTKGAKTIDLAKKADQLREELKGRYGVDPKVIYTCYTGILKGLTIDRLEFWESPLREFGVRSETTMYSSLISGNNVLIPFLRRIKSQLRELPSPHVYLVGHSYGAWTAVHTAISLQEEFSVVGLLTIDAISPVHCKPVKMILSGLLLRSPLGCRQFPRDLRPDWLLPNVDWWQNVYQDGFYFLHSSAVIELEESSEDRPEGHLKNVVVREFSWDPHGSLGNHTLPWSLALQLIRSPMDPIHLK